MKYRRPLLPEGVRLYELRPEAAGPNGPRRSGITIGSSRASLHGKTFVFDGTSVFIGSLNLDPRSLQQNTEVGVLVQSPELAAEVVTLRSEEHTSELQSPCNLVCRLLLEKKKTTMISASLSPCCSESMLLSSYST